MRMPHGHMSARLGSASQIKLQAVPHMHRGHRWAALPKTQPLEHQHRCEGIALIESSKAQVDRGNDHLSKSSTAKETVFRSALRILNAVVCSATHEQLPEWIRAVWSWLLGHRAEACDGLHLVPKSPCPHILWKSSREVGDILLQVITDEAVLLSDLLKILSELAPWMTTFSSRESYSASSRDNS